MGDYRGGVTADLSGSLRGVSNHSSTREPATHPFGTFESYQNPSHEPGLVMMGAVVGGIGLLIGAAAPVASLSSRAQRGALCLLYAVVVLGAVAYFLFTEKGWAWFSGSLARFSVDVYADRLEFYKTKKPGAKRRVLRLAGVQSIRRDPVYVAFSYVGAGVTITNLDEPVFVVTDSTQRHSFYISKVGDGNEVWRQLLLKAAEKNGAYVSAGARRFLSGH